MEVENGTGTPELCLATMGTLTFLDPVCCVLEPQQQQHKGSRPAYP